MSGLNGRVVPRDHILQRLSDRAAVRGNEVAITFVTDSQGTQARLTWAELRDRAVAARSVLKGFGLGRGDRVLVSLPAGEAHLATILGALWAGIVPATAHISPQGSERPQDEEWRSLVDALKPSAIVTAAHTNGLDLPVIHPDEIVCGTPIDSGAVDLSDVQNLSYVQFTSGSTGRPKGVALEWTAIAENLTAIGRAAPLTPDDHMFSWLPMYHDMGWFGGLLAPLYIGARLTVMDVGLFVLNPLLWMRAMADVRATMTVTPPSALRASLELLKRRPLASRDLSSLRQVICGAEPISPKLIDHFKDVLVPYGVPESALRPVYGLAEATLAVTFPPNGRKPRVDRVRRDRFERDNAAEPTAPDDTDASLARVSVGIPLDGLTVGIFDDSGRQLGERVIGRVLVQSPSTLSAVVLSGSMVPWSDEWLDTGDLGYLAQGELYITGRRKDLIVKYGQKFSPDRLEEVACRFKGIRRAAAFGVFDDTSLTDRVVLLAETHYAGRGRAIERDAVRLAVRAEMRASGFIVDDIVLVRKGSLAHTTSGKIRRSRCRELYLSGEFEALEDA